MPVGADLRVRPFLLGAKSPVFPFCVNNYQIFGIFIDNILILWYTVCSIGY